MRIAIKSNFEQDEAFWDFLAKEVKDIKKQGKQLKERAELYSKDYNKLSTYRGVDKRS